MILNKINFQHNKKRIFNQLIFIKIVYNLRTHFKKHNMKEKTPQ